MKKKIARSLPGVCVGVVLGLAAAHAHLAPPAHAQHGGTGGDPDAILRELLEGNQRFLAGKCAHPHSDPARMDELAKGQHPKAVVLACADSRVAPEILLDQGLGDLFTIRVAGNVLEPSILGSIEYAVEHLGTTLCVVLGHSRCGGVTAALEAHGHPNAFVALGPNLERLVEHIEPAIASLPPGLEGDARLDAAVEANTRLVVDELDNESEIVRNAIAAKKLRVVGGVYDLQHEGKVTIFQERKFR